LLIAITAATVINGIPNSKAILVFTHVNVIDVTCGGVQQDMTVVIKERQIAEFETSATLSPPKGARVIEGRGKYLTRPLGYACSRNFWWVGTRG
jgi:imidazolonepropionase-like amidohydrolase